MERCIDELKNLLMKLNLHFSINLNSKTNSVLSNESKLMDATGRWIYTYIFSYRTKTIQLSFSLTEVLSWLGNRKLWRLNEDFQEIFWSNSLKNVDLGTRLISTNVANGRF